MRMQEKDITLYNLVKIDMILLIKIKMNLYYLS